LHHDILPIASPEPTFPRRTESDTWNPAKLNSLSVVFARRAYL
jgi:hypothetical protein